MKLRHLLGDDFPEVTCLMAGVAGAVEISGVSSDSRKIKPGMLFVALSGAQVDGEDFVEDALRRGASAIVSARSEAANVPIFDVATAEDF